MSVKRIGRFKFDMNIKDFSKLKISLPVLIANNSKNHFLQGFRMGAGRGGGFTDASRGGWEKRQRESRLSVRKNILVDSGDLRRKIEKYGILEKCFHRIVIGVTGLKYAYIHNEGGTINHPGGTAYLFSEGKPIWISNKRAAMFEKIYRTKPHLIRMPKREFIGDSQVLERKNEVIIRREIDKIFAK